MPRLVVVPVLVPDITFEVVSDLVEVAVLAQKNAQYLEEFCYSPRRHIKKEVKYCPQSNIEGTKACNLHDT